MRTVTERELIAAFVALAGSPDDQDDRDAGDHLGSLVRGAISLLDIGAAGVLLAGDDGALGVAASSDDVVAQVEAAALAGPDGPGVDCFRTFAAVGTPDLGTALDRWPRFAALALGAGYTGAYALPLRVGGAVIGAITLHRAAPATGTACEAAAEIWPGDDALTLAQGLADVAAATVVRRRALRQSGVLAHQLRSALDSRVVIEQAKGILAERGGFGVDEAFTQLRGYARRNRIRLADLADGIVDGTVDTRPVLGRPAAEVRGRR
ncbi:ANTAR domain-containing protein [Actinopolymorpha sp. NPDC004070]|uniref:ANTAR domain-containing protein n=1 Tax=Actinopolymorpha sp. NPDC004070 TaxID=3154548 RepID=UPI0033AE0776